MTVETADQSHERTGASRGLLLVISGPSGVGKTSIVRGLRERLGGSFSVSATTRPRTAREVEGLDYYFVSDERFRAMLDAGEFLEHALVFGRHYYGTPRLPVEAAMARGELVILDIDVQGGLQVKKAMAEALMLFVLPPGDDELLRRLRGRAREDESVIQRRFAEAKREIDLATSSGAYDHMVVNDELERAVDEACRIVDARRSVRG
jgi:guanylate kinase